MNPELSKAVVLIVDDEAAIRELVKRVAETITNVDTLLASSAAVALHLVETASPALVISDLSMPGEKGDWLLSQVRQKGLAIPFVILSGSIDVSDEERLLRLGANRIVQKPASPITLRNLMIEMLSKEVRFEVVAETGSEVFVAGTFNHWEPGQYRLQDVPDRGFFSTTLRLPRGHYEYKFIINGNWCMDPKCSASIRNAYGSMNSMVQV